MPRHRVGGRWILPSQSVSLCRGKRTATALSAQLLATSRRPWVTTTRESTVECLGSDWLDYFLHRSRLRSHKWQHWFFRHRRGRETGRRGELQQRSSNFLDLGKGCLRRYRMADYRLSRGFDRVRTRLQNLTFRGGCLLPSSVNDNCGSCQPNE